MAEVAQLKLIPLNRIRESAVALRAVDRKSGQYLELVDSIRKNGVMNAILVREIKDQDSGEILYGLIDGLHRFSGAQDAGLAEIPAQIRSMADAAVLEAQVIANVHKVETKPVEYAKQLMRILAQNPTLTMAELATKLAKSPAWLNDRLGLVKLPEEIGKLVDEGRIILANAYALAKLAAIDTEEVSAFLDRAMTLSPQEFVPVATGRIKELRDLKRQGRDAAPATFEAHPVLRKLSELKEELEKSEVGPLLVRELKVTDPAKAFELGIAWSLKMDSKSIEGRKQAEADRLKQLEEEKKKRKEAKDKEKQDADIKKAAELVLPK